MYLIMSEDKEDHFDHLQGPAWKFALSDLDEWLRSQIKYSEKEYLQEARDELHNILDSRGLELW